MLAYSPVLFLQFFVANSKHKEHNDINVRKRSETTIDEEAFLVRKCCPSHLYLDEWYDCVDRGETVLAEFNQELLEVTKRNESEYKIVQADDWRKCPERLRREYEVITISEDHDKVYVLSDIMIIYDDEEEQNFERALEIEYECLE